jgi:hypothetical protein
MPRVGIDPIGRELVGRAHRCDGDGGDENGQEGQTSSHD